MQADDLGQNGTIVVRHIDFVTGVRGFEFIQADEHLLMRFMMLGKIRYRQPNHQLHTVSQAIRIEFGNYGIK